MSAYDRTGAIKSQAGSYKTSYTDVQDEVLAKSGLAEELTKSHTLYDMLHRGPAADYQVHHIVPISTLSPLYANTTPEQGKQLQEILHSGNHPRNLFVAPTKSHLGKKAEQFVGVHKRLENEGLQPRNLPGGQQGPLDITKARPLIKEIYNARNAPFEVKLQLAERFNNELSQEYRNQLDDALYENKEWSGVDTQAALQQEESWANAKGKAQAHMSKGELPM